MARLIEQIIRDAPTERRKIHVPAWKGEALPDGDVYFRPRTKAVMEEALPRDDRDLSHGILSLYMLVATAEDVHGNRIFAEKDIDALREKADLSVLAPVEAFMWGTQAPDIKEAEKVIAADPISASA